MKTDRLALFALVALTALVSLEIADGAKILYFFPGGTYSHKVSVWPWVQAMADRGHQVTYVSAYEKQPKKDERVRDVVPKFLEVAMKNHFKVNRLQDRLDGVERRLFDNYWEDSRRFCKGIIASLQKDLTFRQLFDQEPFDLMINNVILGDCGYILADRVIRQGGQMIIFDSTYILSWYPESFGFPTEMAWVPEGPNVGNFPMGFVDRLQNSLLPLYWDLIRKWTLFQDLGELGAEHFGLDNPIDLEAVERKTALLLYASHYTTDFARSLPPFVIPVGGMQCWEKREPFEGEYKQLLDSAKQGAILISFGSTVDFSKAPSKFIEAFLGATARFPEVLFLWRWPGEKPEEYTPNNVFSSWLPQFEILGHPNLKTFISHAGLNSYTEAMCHGVPPILLPLFSDQDYNAYQLQANENGIRLEFRELTEDILVNAINEILSDDRYRKNIGQASKLLRDRPMSPIETAVWWTEYSLRHNDTSALKPIQIHWIQRNFLDALAFACVTGAVSILVMIQCCWRRK